MLIKKGSTRIVFLFPALGVVVKLPIVYVNSAYRSMKVILLRICKKQMSRTQIYSLIGHPDIKISIMGNLFGGIYNNLSEWTFFLRTRHGFCYPTYFSFFGLCNIQKYGEQLKDDFVWADIFYEYVSPITQEMDRHHWATPSNFTRRGNKLYLLDYGSKRTREILIKFRNQLEALEISLPTD